MKDMKGYFVPIFTPFNRDGSIDEAAMRQNISNDSDSNPNTDTPRTGWTGFRLPFLPSHLFFFHLATSRGKPGGFWNDPGRVSNAGL